jgi:hypothetical protein
MPAPTIDELLVADDSARWQALGFAVIDGRCRLGEVHLRFLDGDETKRGIVGWSLRDLAKTELDGLTTTVSERPPSATAAAIAPVHPNGVIAIDHIVAASPRLERSVSILQEAGLDLRRVREQPTPAGAPRQAFFRLGAEILELIQEPKEVIERTGGPEHPARFWGLALCTHDLDRTVQSMGAHAGSIRPAVQAGRHIATVRRSAGLSVPLALMSTAGSV